MESPPFVQKLRTEKQTGNVASGQNGCAKTTLSRQLKKCDKRKEQIILQANFIRIYVLKYIFLSSNILSISLYTTA